MRAGLIIRYVAVLAGLALAAGSSHTLAAGIMLTGMDGRPASAFFMPAGQPPRGFLFVFVAHDCPIANAYAPELGRIFRAYTRRGVECAAVYAEPGLSAETARDHLSEYRLGCRGLLDPAHRLVKLAGVTVTPEAALFDSNRRLVYRGRIDNRYLNYGRERDHATILDLREALDALLSGRPVKVSKTRAIGCFIPK